MKMKDVFPEVFEVEHNKSFEVQNCHYVCFGDDKHTNCEQDEAIAHAVLNHDKLTEENARLREALSNAYDLLLISGWDDAYKDDINTITKLLKGDEDE